MKVKLRDIQLWTFCAYMFGISASYISPSLEPVFNLMMYAFILITIVRVLFQKNLTIKGHTRYYFVFFAVCAVSLLYAPSKSSAFNSLYQVILCLVFSFCIHQLRCTKKDIELIGKVYILGIAVLFVYLLLTGRLITTEIRFGGELTGNANAFAMIIMVGTFFSSYFILSSKGFGRIAGMICFAMQMYLLVLSGGRKFPSIGLIVFIFMFLYSHQKNTSRPVFRRIIISALIVLLAYWAVLNVPFLYEHIGYRFETMFSGRSGMQQEASAFVRAGMRAYGLRKSLESPIWGYGLNSFASISGYGSYSHNNYIEMLFSGGIILLIAYYIYPVKMLLAMRKEFSNDAIQLLFGSIIIGLLLFDYGAVTYNMILTQVLISILSSYYVSQVLGLTTNKTRYVYNEQNSDICIPTEE